MARTEVISVRVREGLKRELEEAGVDVSSELRRFLEDLAWKVRVRTKIREWRSLLDGVTPSERGFSVGSVREDRDSR